MTYSQKPFASNKLGGSWALLLLEVRVPSLPGFSPDTRIPGQDQELITFRFINPRRGMSLDGFEEKKRDLLSCFGERENHRKRRVKEAVAGVGH